jgi:ABC-type branched-subunit amino acid transport system ATPase component
MSILKVDNLCKNFGGVQAVNGLNFEINEGEIFGLIGPNGSGKSTTINVICGLYRPSEGSIFLDGKKINGLKPNQCVDMGISRTFQNIRLFGDLTVWQNIWVAWKDDRNSQPSWFNNWFGKSTTRDELISELLSFSGLETRANDLANNLSFGEQRRLELARAVASKPKLIFLDEPAAGMNKEEVKELRDRIFRLRDLGITIFLVEHVMDLVMNVSNRITVLNFGKVIAEGDPESVQNDKSVQEAYFGQ